MIATAAGRLLLLPTKAKLTALTDGVAVPPAIVGMAATAAPSNKISAT
jgi:hypothetical protein